MREGPSGQVKDGRKGRDGTEVYEDGSGWNSLGEKNSAEVVWIGFAQISWDRFHPISFGEAPHL